MAYADSMTDYGTDSQNSSSVDEMGFPTSDSQSVPTALTTKNPDSTMMGGFISSLEEMGSSAVNSAEAGAVSVYHDFATGASAIGGAVSSGVSSGYQTVKSAAGTVAGDISAPLSGLVDFGLSRVLLVVVVLGGALYFIGKGGAIGQASKLVP